MARHTVLYTTVIDAIRMLRDSWRRESARSEREVLADFADVGLLILDEAGMQFGTDAEQVCLFDIIDCRYRKKRPTLMLTNGNVKVLRELLGERSYDRVRETGHWLTFNWPSYRPEIAAQRRGEAGAAERGFGASSRPALATVSNSMRAPLAHAAGGASTTH